MTKSEAISWYRIHEMFRFESIHMFGIIGVAVIVGVIAMYFMKKMKVKTMRDTLVEYVPMELRPIRHILAGSIFGLGWALVGACPGPIFILLGHGFWIAIVILIGAVLGAFSYGVMKDHLPH